MRIAYDMAGRRIIQVDSDDEEEENNATSHSTESSALESHFSSTTLEDRSQEKGSILGTHSIGQSTPEIDSVNLSHDVCLDYGEGQAVNILSVESSKAGLIYRKLLSRCV